MAAEFDVMGARKEGYSDAEIANHLGQEQGYDVNSARKAGYKDLEIVQHLTAPKMQDVSGTGGVKAELASRSIPERLLTGVGTFAYDAAMRAKQQYGGAADNKTAIDLNPLTGLNPYAARLLSALLDRGQITPEQAMKIKANREMVASDPYVLAGNVGADLATTAIPGAGLAKAGTAIASKVLPRVVSGLQGPAGAAISGAAIAGATQPVLDGESAGGNMARGAAGAALGDAALRAGSRVVQPILQSDAVKNLLARGIVPTPGQAAGANSFLGRTEQKAESQPIIGDIIKRGRDRADTEFNQSALNTAMPAGKVTQAGPKGMQEVDTALSDAYDKVFANQTVRPNQQLLASITAAKQTPTLPLNQAGNDAFDSVIKKAFTDRIPANGQMPAASVKAEIIGDLGKAASKLQNSNDAYQQAVGDALMAARNSVNDWLKQEVSKSSPFAAAYIAHIDKANANKYAVARAVEKAKRNDGMFSGNQLQSSTKPGTPMREFANDANAVLGDRVPNSGTADRMLLSALGIGASTGLANEYLGSPGYLAALAAAPFVYSRAGSRYLSGNLIPGQSRLADLARSSAPYAAQLGRSSATNRDGK